MGSVLIGTTTQRSISRCGRRFTKTSHDPRTPEQEAGLPKSADGKALTDTARVSVKLSRLTREPTFTPRSWCESRTPEKGGVWTPVSPDALSRTIAIEDTARGDEGGRCGISPTGDHP